MHKFSIALLHMLKEKRENLVIDLKNQIAGTPKEIESRATHPAYDSFDKTLTGRVTTFEKETLERKIHKLQRDRGDYLNGNIKYWQHNKQRPSNNKNHNNKNNFFSAATVRPHSHIMLFTKHIHISPRVKMEISSSASSFKHRTFTSTLNKYINRGEKNHLIKYILFLQPLGAMSHL